MASGLPRAHTDANAANRIAHVFSHFNLSDSFIESNATPPGAEGGTPMEISMTDNPNLHPIWAKHFDLESKAKAPVPTASTVVEALIGPTSVQASNRPAPAQDKMLSPAQIEAIFDDNGWIPASSIRPASGAVVEIKKQLSRHTWISTMVLPGDARYPAEFRTVPRAGGQS
jgi:hypothetical protein